MGSQRIAFGITDERVALDGFAERLERTQQRLRAFEERYGMTSEEFEQRFNAGDLAESLDFIEWAGEIKTYQLLEAQWQALQKAQLN